jgi:hypothetical protein
MNTVTVRKATHQFQPARVRHHVTLLSPFLRMLCLTYGGAVAPSLFTHSVWTNFGFMLVVKSEKKKIGHVFKITILSSSFHSQQPTVNIHSWHFVSKVELVNRVALEMLIPQLVKKSFRLSSRNSNAMVPSLQAPAYPQQEDASPHPLS